MPLTIVTAADRSQQRPALTVTKATEKPEPRKLDASPSEAEVPAVVVAKLSAEISSADLKEKIFSQFTENIKGIKKLSADCIMLFLDTRENAMILTAKYDRAEINGEMIYCTPVMKLAAEKKYDIKLRK